MATRWIATLSEMNRFTAEVRSRDKSLALVPTMGALHEGHLSLVRQAKKECDVAVVSIFVNPTQFGPTEDFARYPRSPEKDLEVLKSLKVDAVFAPSGAEIYPAGFAAFVDPGPVATVFEGAIRPGHFRGVVTVVLKLFNIVFPDMAFFGQKDFQQAVVIRRVVEDLNLRVRIIVCPTVREADGLAQSSRNVYLNAEDRKAALALSRSLKRAEEMAQAGESNAEKLLEEMRKTFDAEPRAQLDYAVIANPKTLEPVARVIPGSVALVAARLGTVRLIDNLIFGPPGATPELKLQLALTTQASVDGRSATPRPDIESLRLRIENCRDCAAVSSISLPPREFLVKYLKRDDPELESTRVLVIGGCAPIDPAGLPYCHPEAPNPFATRVYELLGLRNFGEFKAHFALTDAARCHAIGNRVDERTLDYCVKHLREELKLFPNLLSIVILGEYAYLQFQKHILGRERASIKPFGELLRSEGWARETVRLPWHGERDVRIFYCHHPTFESKTSPSLALFLDSLIRQQRSGGRM
jgi:pantoate--beta-alanine ligase